jgi:predicted nuclease with TOPRIM domain
MRSPEAVESERVEKLKAINKLRESLNVIQSERYELKKKLVELDENVRMAKHGLSVLRTEVELLTSEFWNSKHG